ncbi:MAG: hypothetical protein LBE12_01955 [Planctomycetaceae bacterium]|nr:hypothetical protein [Planctomycetaceae bacterium]
MKRLFSLISLENNYLLASLLYLGLGLIFCAIAPDSPKILAEGTGCGGEESCPAGQTCVDGVCKVCDVVCNGECYPAGTSCCDDGNTCGSGQTCCDGICISEDEICCSHGTGGNGESYGAHGCPQNSQCCEGGCISEDEQCCPSSEDFDSHGCPTDKECCGPNCADECEGDECN